MHLILDCSECPREKLADLELIYSFLDTFPPKIQMTKIATPQIVRYMAKKHIDWGISGFILIAESHISIHTFPERGSCNLDIFSCKPFDIKKTIAYIKEQFQPKRIKTNLHAKRLVW